MTPFKIIACDPPWRFRDGLPGPKRGATSHYQCMSLPALCAFELPPLEPNAVMFMWRVSSMQEEALTLAKAWGFKLHSEMVWAKTTRSGKQHFGMGRIVRGAHETCLICVRGKTPPVLNRGVRSLFSAPVGRHSEKPSLFYTLVEQLFDGPRCELFARRHRPGWTCFGNELPANENASLAPDALATVG
jgi:N6-adenosine-specific RNA methylase IME4